MSSLTAQTEGRGAIFLMRLQDERFHALRKVGRLPLIDLGVGMRIDIRALAYPISQVIGFHDSLVFDRSRPDGKARKLLDVARISELG